jgi:translocator protein
MMKCIICYINNTTDIHHRTASIRRVRSLWVALLICALAATLEGVWAGGGVKQRFAALKMPRWAPPLGLWIVIGAAYYVIFFVVLARVLTLPPSPAQSVALGLIVTVLLVNGFWNFLFFRRRDLRLSFLAGVAYSAAALGLLLLLVQLDSTAAAWLMPYAAYLLYANAFGYAVWRANPTESRRTWLSR